MRAARLTNAAANNEILWAARAELPGVRAGCRPARLRRRERRGAARGNRAAAGQRDARHQTGFYLLSARLPCHAISAPGGRLPRRLSRALRLRRVLETEDAAAAGAVRCAGARLPVPGQGLGPPARHPPTGGCRGHRARTGHPAPGSADRLSFTPRSRDLHSSPLLGRAVTSGSLTDPPLLNFVTLFLVVPITSQKIAAAAARPGDHPRGKRRGSVRRRWRPQRAVRRQRDLLRAPSA